MVDILRSTFGETERPAPTDDTYTRLAELTAEVELDSSLTSYDQNVMHFVDRTVVADFLESLPSSYQISY
ncbi:MAG TPA: hypothetical protein VGF75_02495 [Candidatus Saccharimonadales bacterium]|jgi:hypothetical protein